MCGALCLILFCNVVFRVLSRFAIVSPGQGELVTFIISYCRFAVFLCLFLEVSWVDLWYMYVVMAFTGTLIFLYPCKHFL